MAEAYRIYGSEMSPYSVKVRSYFRYKGIAHRWLLRNMETEQEFQTYAKLPLIPLVVTPDNTGLQDSTPIIEHFEGMHAQPSIHPEDPVSRFVSVLLEEFGDEWGNKWMFHMRWARPVDQESAAGRIARSMMPGADEEQVKMATEQVRSRMVDRVWFVGSSEQTAPQIEQSFRDTIELLDVHLAERPYLFGGRPSFGDFGLWAQLYEAWTDPTAGSMIEAYAPTLLAWIHRMLWPRAQGEFEPWSALAPTLEPFVERQVGRLFVPWTLANEKALAEDAETFTVELDGRTWTQKPQKYHAKSLRALREKYAAIGGDADVDALLERTGCLAAFRA